VLLVLLFSVVLAACDAIDTAAVEEQAVVEAYLEAGADLPQVILSRTAPVDAGPGGQEAIRGADVFIDRLDAGGEVAATTTYSETDSVGFYAPEGVPPQVEPGATYRLRVELEEGPDLSAETTVPAGLELVEEVNTESVFQSPEQPSFTLTRATVRDAPVVFIFTTTSQLDFDAMDDEAIKAELTPFYADAFDEDEDDLRDFRVTASPIVNEANYEDNGDGTITTDYPWIALAFFGENEVAVSVLDRALYDYIRTQGAQQGGLSPGEIPNIVDNIDGGTGVFGSYARIATTITVERP
jgi:hypothetical protein